MQDQREWGGWWSMTQVSVAVFASGTGSNFRRLYDQANAGELAPGQVTLLVSDRPDCGAATFAATVGLPAFVATHKSLGGKDAWELAVVEELRQRKVDLVVLAGYMRIVGPVLLAAFGGRMINLHPSYLPEFKGLDAIGQALGAGVKETGVSVHYVNSGLDDGPVIRQERVPILPDDNVDSLAKRIHAVEHVLLPAVVWQLCLEYAKQKHA